MRKIAFGPKKYAAMIVAGSSAAETDHMILLVVSSEADMRAR